MYLEERYVSVSRQAGEDRLLSILEMPMPWETEVSFDERPVNLTGQDAVEFHKRRRAAQEATAKAAKTSGQVAMGLRSVLMQPSSPGYITEGHMAKMLKAQCKRLSGRSTVIGNTVFNFDKDGICRIPEQGNTSLDFVELLKQNGVVHLTDDETVAPSDHVTAQASAPPAEPAPPEPPKMVPAETPMSVADLPKAQPVDADMAAMEESPPDLVVPSEKHAEKTEKSHESRRKPVPKNR